MLTYTEVPGLYVQIDTGFVCIIDHIEATVIEITPNSIKLRLHNPTEYKASLKVFAEKSTDMKMPLGQNTLYGCRRIELDSKETKIFEVN